VAAPGRRAADPAGKQAAGAGGLLPRAVVVLRDAPTAVVLGGPGRGVSRPAQAASGRHTSSERRPSHQRAASHR
jgi:hypothetical protein